MRSNPVQTLVFLMRIFRMIQTYCSKPAIFPKTQQSVGIYPKQRYRSEYEKNVRGDVKRPSFLSNTTADVNWRNNHIILVYFQVYKSTTVAYCTTVVLIYHVPRPNIPGIYWYVYVLVRAHPLQRNACTARLVHFNKITSDTRIRSPPLRVGH